MAVVVVTGIAFLALLACLRLSISRHLERQGYRRSRMPPSLNTDHHFSEGDLLTFRGGSRVGRRNATTPLVTLRFDDSWAHLSGGAQFFGGPEPVWIERSAVVGVHRVRLPLSPGIRFETDDGRYDGVIFWTKSPAAVLDALRDRDWPVSDGSITDRRAV